MKDLSQLDSSRYTEGADRYINFTEDFLNMRLAAVQELVLSEVANNQRTLVWGANGPGKSYITSALKVGFLFTNTDSIVLGTSGSYQQYEDTMWKPLKNMFEDTQEKYGLPGKLRGGNRPSLTLDNEWYAKIVSPRDPGELEGRHGSDVLVVIDEADKKYITKEHFSSAGSSITDMNDKMVAICNPPEDSDDVVARKKEDPRWNVVEISAFESHNALVDAGRIDDDHIEGLVDLITIADDWEAWNNRQWPLAEKHFPGDDWPGMAEIKPKVERNQIDRDEVCSWLAPGFDVAKEAHLRFDTLDKQWYIRRAGIIPPMGAAEHRPIEPEHVKESWDRNRPRDSTASPRAIGIDVARSSDKTVMIGEHNGELRVHYSKTGDNHETQKREVVDGTQNTPGLNSWPSPDVAVDKGYAPGFHDYVADQVPNVVDFMSGTKPTEPTRWYDKWAEALFHFGQWLENGGVISDPDIRQEALVAARVVSYEARSLNSRGRNGAEVYKATAKEEIKDELGHSPDFLDGSLMAIWRLRTNPAPSSVKSTWYDPYETGADAV